MSCLPFTLAGSSPVTWRSCNSTAKVCPSAISISTSVTATAPRMLLSVALSTSTVTPAAAGTIALNAPTERSIAANRFIRESP